MSMTVGELLEHADRLQSDLDHKRRQIRDGLHTPKARAGLLMQINALASRVDEIQSQCAGHSTADPVVPAPAAASSA